MENWSVVAKILISCTGLSLVFSFFSLLFSAISARATVATVQNVQQQRRFTAYVHFAAVTLVLVTAAYGGVIYFSNSPTASARSSEPAAGTCPCSEETKPTNEDPAKLPQRTNTSSNSGKSQAAPSKRSANFLIDAIRYDYSHNALMGRFAGTILIENGKVKFVIPNPIFRVAGRHEIPGRRTIKGITIGIADYDELIKVSRGQGGNIAWSDRLEFIASRDPGEEYAENKTIELSVPVGSIDLKGKAVIVKIDNELTSCGNPLEPSYALSSKDIFY